LYSSSMGQMLLGYAVPRTKQNRVALPILFFAESGLLAIIIPGGASLSY